MNFNSYFFILLASLIPCIAGFGQEVKPMPTSVVNFSRYDIEAVGFGQSPGVAATESVSDVLARRVVNFRYMRAGSVLGAIFQSSYIDSKTKDFKADDSFRVWGPSAAANGIRVGVYHFYRPTVAETGWQWKAQEGGVEVEYKSAERIGFDPVRFPIGVPGSAIPLECNFFSGSPAQLLQFWDAGGWTASPK